MHIQKIAVPTLFLWLSSSILVLSALTGCVVAPAPYNEYNLARTAIRAAQEVDSQRMATGLWNKAEEAFRNGQKSFKESEFSDAKLYFIAAQDYAEKAENATRLKKFLTGDSFP